MPPKAIKKPGSRNLGAARPADDKRSGGAEVRSSSPPGQADIEPASLLAKTTEALRESNERFRAFLDHAPCLAFVKGTDGRYLYVNRRFEEVFFARHVTVVGKTDVELFPREQAAQFQSHDRQVLESARAMEFEETAEYTDGLHTSIVVKFPLRDAVGRIYALGGIVTDITARKRAEEALREKEDLTRAFLENSATVAWMKDAEGRHVYVSPTFERRFNLRLKDWVGKTDFDLWPPDIADTFRANDRIVLEENRRLEVIERSRNADGSSSWWLSSKFPYRDAVGRKYVGGLGVEITARKYAEEELQRSQAELRRQRERLQDLASKLITAQERERQRIARDLHDDFSQRLAALVLDMASLEQQPPVLPELIPASLALLREQLEQLSDDLHNLAYQLHPSLLVHAGLQPAIEDQIQKVTARTGLRILLKARKVPVSLSLDQSTCLFRVLQESLQNIVKHAQATDVLVRLSGSSNGVGLSVIDNGRGFDISDKRARQKGLGLISMEERLRFLNGFLRVHSGPADGTKVCAWIPFRGGTT